MSRTTRRVCVKESGTSSYCPNEQYDRTRARRMSHGETQLFRLTAAAERLDMHWIAPKVSSGTTTSTAVDDVETLPPYGPPAALYAMDIEDSLTS